MCMASRRMYNKHANYVLSIWVPITPSLSQTDFCARGA